MPEAPEIVPLLKHTTDNKTPGMVKRRTCRGERGRNDEEIQRSYRIQLRQIHMLDTRVQLGGSRFLFTNNHTPAYTFTHTYTQWAIEQANSSTI